MRSREEIERALAFKEYNDGIERSRHEHEHHPIVSHPMRCQNCGASICECPPVGDDAA